MRRASGRQNNRSKNLQISEWGDEKECDAERIYEKIIIENFPILVKDLI